MKMKIKMKEINRGWKIEQEEQEQEQEKQEQEQEQQQQEEEVEKDVVETGKEEIKREDVMTATRWFKSLINTFSCQHSP